MKRSFRVATVFTGVAACAAVFAPAAEAAPAAPGVMTRIAPDTVTAYDCSVANTALHLYYTPSESHSIPACFSGTGYWYVGTGKRFDAYCAGDYSGSLEVDGTWRRFTEGAHKLYGSVEEVYIAGRPYENQICYQN
jgi:hypothetical protein